MTTTGLTTDHYHDCPKVLPPLLMFLGLLVVVLHQLVEELKLSAYILKVNVLSPLKR